MVAFWVPSFVFVVLEVVLLFNRVYTRHSSSYFCALRCVWAPRPCHYPVLYCLVHSCISRLGLHEIRAEWCLPAWANFGCVAWVHPFIFLSFPLLIHASSFCLFLTLQPRLLPSIPAFPHLRLVSSLFPYPSTQSLPSFLTFPHLRFIFFPFSLPYNQVSSFLPYLYSFTSLLSALSLPYSQVSSLLPYLSSFTSHLSPFP